MRDHMWSVPCLYQWYEGCEMMWISSSVQYPDQHLSRQFQGNEEAAKHVTHVQLHKNLTMTVRLMAIQMPLLRNFFAATPFHHLQWLTASDFFSGCGHLQILPPCTWCCHESQPAMQQQLQCFPPQTPKWSAKQNMRRLWVEEATGNTVYKKHRHLLSRECFCRNVCVCYNYLAQSLREAL